MLCPDCHGYGSIITDHWAVLSGMDEPVLIGKHSTPCLRCTGGIAHCCDGEVCQPAKEGAEP